MHSNPISRPAGLAQNPGPEACFINKGTSCTFLVTTAQTQKSPRQRYAFDMVHTRSGRCGSPTPTLTTEQPPSPSAGTINDAPDDVADLSSKLSSMQSPSKVTKTPPASPTPRHRRSKTPKHDESSYAGQSHKSNTTMDMDLENIIDDAMGNCDKLIDNEGTVDIMKDTCCASNSVDNNNELENTSNNFCIPGAPPPLNIGDIRAALLSGGGEPRPDNVKPEGEFKCAQNLFSSIKTIFLDGDMNNASLRRKTKAKFGDQDDTPWGNARKMMYGEKEVDIPKRGKFYCAHKTADSSNNCTWNVAYTWVKEKQAFVILNGNGPDKSPSYNTNFCLEHSHRVDGVCRGVNDAFVVSRKDDLESEEMDFIRSVAQIHCSVPEVQDALHNKFGKKNNRRYSAVLLNNLLGSVRDQLFGKDRHQMKELLEDGARIIRDGGVFDWDVNDFRVLIGLRYQSYLMRQVAEQFGSYFFTMDGTYGMSAAGLTFCPMVTVDCCGLSMCCGVFIALSENSKDAIKACKQFNLSSVLDESEEVKVSDQSFCDYCSRRLFVFV